MSTAQRSKKRSRNSSPISETHKRLKLTSTDEGGAVNNASSNSVAPEARQSQSGPSETKPRQRIKKLTPARPFPSVPTSASATGPRSAHTEGKNLICITRKTSLAAYMRRCKDIILKDGYKTLRLSAMGAAIPLLLQLSLALPPILPFSPDEIHTEILTGTVEVQDEIIPDDEEEDISYRTRGKSTLKIDIVIGDGEFSGGPIRNSKRARKGKARVEASGKNSGAVENAEPQQVDVEMV
ncbi:hypothetical protein GYMLUDRAFT_901014 [Collybiopsis luxurians FD-317 M1]|uniref:Uncharacterized protein n=1 Tax=Collybiopsis luxurians FD-317 M1 TaxID=944289 RepID=A0A0D0CHY0_9AGAR|nr:hypothetical protein GYMLUDRAFT_901014 [Collybiopsis luxurians FD-317 M1]